MASVLDQLPEIFDSEKTPLVVLLLELVRQQERLVSVAERQLTPLRSRIASLESQVVQLLEQNHLQKEQLQSLKDEIARLKGHSQRPKIKPSGLEGKKARGKKKRRGKRPGSKKRSKTCNLEIHETVVVEPDDVPDGSLSKGYEDFVVQELVIEVRNIRYRRARYRTPEGRYVLGQLPDDVKGHFGPTLTSFILYQYYHCHVTQPLIHEQLREWGVDISAGQVNRIITLGKEQFHAEKAAILRVGLMVSGYVHVDDTGARHNGKNGVCTHIGNELFAWFSSTQSKSRINFFELLGAGKIGYFLSEAAFDYMKKQKLPNYIQKRLAPCAGGAWESREEWEAVLVILDICAEHHVRAVTEGALLGSLFENGLNPELIIVSDDAGQFNVLVHALCWVHAERNIAKLLGFNDSQRAILETVRTQIWTLYRDLKSYQKAPDTSTKTELQAQFDAVFAQKTGYASLDLALKRLQKKQGRTPTSTRTAADASTQQPQ